MELNKNIGRKSLHHFVHGSEVARAIRQTASRKATGPADVPAELFKTGGESTGQNAQNMCGDWKLVSSQRNGRSPHSSHFPRKVTLNSVKTTEQLLWFPMQARSFFGSYTAKDPSEDRNRNCRHRSTELCDCAKMAIFASCNFSEARAAHFEHAF